MDTCKRTQPREHECGFGIFQQPDGSFGHTDVQEGKNGSIDGMAIRMPRTATLVAFGHTHPRGEHISDEDDTSNAFSKEDLAYAKRMGLEMFMGSEKTGQVVRYKRGETKEDKHSRLGTISYGTPVGPYGFPEPTRRDQLSAAYDAQTTPGTP